MIKEFVPIKSHSNIPFSKRVNYTVSKQSFLFNLILEKILKKKGIGQLWTYYKTYKRDPQLICPYMPNELPKSSFLYDFHSHTSLSDGMGSFKEFLLTIVKKEHLDGIAITDHPFLINSITKERHWNSKVLENSFKAHKLIEQYKSQGKLPDHFISFPGSSEFFMRVSEEYVNNSIELIALGLDKDFIKNMGDIKKIADGYSIDFIEKVHDHNGIVIMPHPFQFFHSSHQILKHKDLSRNSMPDAVEAYNYIISFITSSYDFSSLFQKFEPINFQKELTFLSKLFGYGNWMASQICYKNNLGKNFNYPVAQKIAKVGSSDAHFLSCIGAGSTMVREPITSLEDLRKIFNAKKTTPMLNPKWVEKTDRNDIIKEILQVYGSKINDSIGNADNGLINRWVVFKVLTKILMLILG